MRCSFIECPKCHEEIEGIWPSPPEGDEQDEQEAPKTQQTCPCGAVWYATYPGYSFHQEAG
jgi:hypothetical protein